MVAWDFWTIHSISDTKQWQYSAWNLTNGYLTSHVSRYLAKQGQNHVWVQYPFVKFPGCTWSIRSYEGQFHLGLINYNQCMRNGKPAWLSNLDIAEKSLRISSGSSVILYYLCICMVLDIDNMYHIAPTKECKIPLRYKKTSWTKTRGSTLPVAHSTVFNSTPEKRHLRSCHFHPLRPPKIRKREVASILISFPLRQSKKIPTDPLEHTPDPQWVVYFKKSFQNRILVIFGVCSRNLLEFSSSWWLNSPYIVNLDQIGLSPRFAICLCPPLNIKQKQGDTHITNPATAPKGFKNPPPQI